MYQKKDTPWEKGEPSPGCGTGHDARVWAKAEFHLGDFLRDEPIQLFDWIFEHTCFCAIQPAERELYVAAVSRWLKPKGQYLSVNYLIPDTDGPPFGTTREEIVERFSPGFKLIEDWVPRSYPNRTGLERLFWWGKR